MIKTKKKKNYVNFKKIICLKIKVYWDKLSLLEFLLFLHATENIASEKNKGTHWNLGNWQINRRNLGL